MAGYQEWCQTSPISMGLSVLINDTFLGHDALTLPNKDHMGSLGHRAIPANELGMSQVCLGLSERLHICPSTQDGVRHWHGNRALTPVCQGLLSEWIDFYPNRVAAKHLRFKGAERFLHTLCWAACI